MKQSIPRIISQLVGGLVFAWLGIYWIWLVKASDQSWYTLPLGVLCLLMAVWDIFGAVRGLWARKQGGKEDAP